MPRNLPLFIAFRLLFNARYYYPVFAVIQLDYGLTLPQFAILNTICPRRPCPSSPSTTISWRTSMTCCAATTMTSGPWSMAASRVRTTAGRRW